MVTFTLSRLVLFAVPLPRLVSASLRCDGKVSRFVRPRHASGVPSCRRVLNMTARCLQGEGNSRSRTLCDAIGRRQDEARSARVSAWSRVRVALFYAPNHRCQSLDRSEVRVRDFYTAYFWPGNFPGNFEFYYNKVIRIRKFFLRGSYVTCLEENLVDSAPLMSITLRLQRVREENHLSDLGW